MSRKSNVILCAGWVAMVAVGVGLFIVPAVRSRADLEMRIENLRIELAKPNAGPEAIEELSRDRASLMAFGAGRMTPIPSESDVGGLIESLTRTLSDEGLQDRDITTRPSKSLEGANALPVTVAVTGEFPRIFDTLARIESMPRLVRVERMRVQAEDQHAGARGRAPKVRAEMLIEVFYTPKTEVGTVAAERLEGGAR